MDPQDIEAAPRPNEEEAASLRALGALAAEEGAQEQKIAEQAQAQENAVLMSLEQENEQALMLVADLATPVFGGFGFPTVARVLQEQNEGSGLTNAQTLAKAWAPVLTKYGVSLGDLGGQYKDEIGAVLVTVPIATALWQAVKADAGAKPKPAPKAVVQEAAPAAAGAEPERLG
ncbi:MAG: hypothetical protein ACXU9C_01685 [Xanthobacteraceae bacterium]